MKGLRSLRTLWSSVPAADATLKLVLCSFLDRDDALRVTSLVDCRATCWELLAELATLKEVEVEIETGPKPPEAVTPRLKPLECCACELLDCESSLFSLTPCSL